ncbi:protein kinase [Luteibacter rhizovicinus DSM 16549]|uniref:Protein kinase n=1 Tax=Luteibacter rhizovicinus DSM 16549 TaxID=1440763 RepID=A0A0G9H8E0_9GAMM|nr:ATPase domain-containing protein [Luteibacter rhizovicinus]APG04293.1 protein kinase [Luteibacter rhizovicinus DSM 16549]KLD66075.1 protein kinase [Luteibacter rhizovicinus DSM 16549]KLD78773.1 protein kinase [Xanthomonas hyacinthi DSM 19077]
MSSNVNIRRLPTGVEGLDEVLGGGIPEYSFNLIAGAPGCGKTTLAHQMMFAMATAERPTLYFTVLGEPPLKMLRYMQQFPFFDQDVVSQSVRFINLTDETLVGDLDAVLDRIVQEVETHNPGLIFVDSFRSVAMASTALGNAQHHLQRFVQKLGMVMTSWQATTFLIGEYFDEADANPVFTIADGLLWVRQSVLRNSMVRKLEVMKMRGQPSLPGLHTFRITSTGIKVFAPVAAASRKRADALPPLDDRLGMGVAGLDAMMGGGLPRGYSLLVAGPSGSGKSIMAAAFLAAGAQAGETGVMVSFEQHSNRTHALVLRDLIEAGKIGVVGVPVSGLSINEVLLLILGEVRKLQATRVVIDSLSGFELAIAPSFKADFRESLSQMVFALADEGVTVLMTSELEDRYGDLRFSPYGTAFMTDAIIVQRYVEIDSRLLRVLAVAKLRASAHSDELRLFQIDDQGLHIGERATGYQGLLGGRPSQVSQPASGLLSDEPP